MTWINTGRGRVPRGVRRAFVAAGLAVSLVGGSAPPASAGTSHPNVVNEAGGVQEHTGVLVVPPAPCAHYHNFRGMSAFDTDAPGQSPQPVVVHGTGTPPPDATFNGRFRADIEQPLGDQVTWYEFTDGSHKVATCGDAAGQVISGFTVTITTQSSTTNDSLTCPAFPATYKRVATDQTFTGTATCTVGDGDGNPVSAARTGTITLVTKIVACEPPIAPPGCVTRGGTITFTGYTP